MPPTQRQGRPPKQRQGRPLGGLFAFARAFAGVGWLAGGLLAVMATFIVCLLSLPRPWAVAWLAVMGAELLVPLSIPAPAWALRFCRFSIAELRSYFPTTWVLWAGG